MTTTLIFDADILVYKFSLREEKAIYWGDDLWTLHADVGQVIEGMDKYVLSLEKLLEADSSVMVLSDPNDNFRKRVLPTYKANRKGTRKPVTFTPARTHLTDAYRSFQRPGLEGDDVCGILATSTKLIRGHSIIVSIDKDFGCIPAPCFVGCEDNGDPSIRHPTEAEADYFHMFQTLTGDTVDGYSGCPGVGPVGAQKVLDTTPWWDAVVAAYAKAGLGEEEALRQARVARILRASDYDFKRKEPILWTSPT